MNYLKTTSVLQKLYKNSTREDQLSLVGTHDVTNSPVHYPLVISAIKQSIKYFERLQDQYDSGTLVEDAFSEQQIKNTSYYIVNSQESTRHHTLKRPCFFFLFKTFQIQKTVLRVKQKLLSFIRIDGQPNTAVAW